MKVLVLFYSTYGHIYRMAQAVAEGARGGGADVVMKRVPETLRRRCWPRRARPRRRRYSPTSRSARCAISRWRTPSSSGRPPVSATCAARCASSSTPPAVCGAQGKLVGKVGSVFTSTATQHGGQESTILTFHVTLLHHGMMIVGLPYTFQGQTRIDEITGCSPYGASTIAGGRGERLPSDNELDGARFQGRHVAQIAKKLSA